MDAFNVLNHPVFSNLSTSLTSPSFGQITLTLGAGINGTAAAGRQLEFSGTINF
jgi:hypothetical protein